MAMQLAQLQNLCKRDPVAYKEEFLMQLNHFESQLKIFQLKPTSNFKEFQEQATFLSHVASCYKEETKSLPKQLSQLLEQNCGIMEHDLRKTLAKALILLRNRDLITPLEVLQLFFKLFKVPDKQLRELLYNHIVSDIKNLNAKHKNNKINNALQNFMFTMMQDSNEVCAKKAMDVMIELYQKRLWNDTKTVNAISLGCFSKNSKILVAALRFFLGGDSTNDELSDSDEEKSKAKVMSKTAKEIYVEYHKGSKKTRSKEKKMKVRMQKAKKLDSKRHRKYQPNFAAIDLINDPQGFSEKLFARLPSTTERFEVRLMMMNLLSRLIGTHKVLLFNFYPFLQKYLGPKQEHITYILAVLAQSCHELVPQEILEPVIRTLADKFVHDRCSPEVIAIGINTIREICMRCPLAIDQDLLQDLVKYKENKDKGVIMAARSLVNFYRTTYPAMLSKKDRGKGHDIGSKPLAYGETKVSSGIEGIELLERFNEKRANNPDEDLSDLEQSSDEGEEIEDMESSEGEDEDMQSIDGEEGEEEQDGEEENEMEEGEEGGWQTASDDGEGEWMDVNDSDNEGDEEEDEDEGESKEEQEPETKKVHIDSLQLLTQEDFERLQRLKDKRKTEDGVDVEISEFVDPTDIEGFKKKQKMTLEERKESIMAGREGRDFGSRRKSFSERKKGSSSNKEKIRNKPFQLVKFKKEIRAKKFRSLKEKQQARLGHAKLIKRLKKFKH